ncbi:hypothetical protein [Sphingosinicella sp. BN140058]|uniref:hypothetical protein n=1 Tax=Sphingosinicella sp. BN140058 TaxID=1892855 RepID=UPI0010101F3C|nr:hypothetical protein [Sphingosinicella sp. BN140058]QAY80350.1 hypothetical protein ETR14_27290 [Sphingosinicella sp. BN140058]
MFTALSTHRDGLAISIAVKPAIPDDVDTRDPAAVEEHLRLAFAPLLERGYDVQIQIGSSEEGIDGDAATGTLPLNNLPDVDSPFSSPGHVTFEEWRATGRDIEDLRDPSVLDTTQLYPSDNPDPIPGRVYEPGWIEKRADDTWYMIIGNWDGFAANLEDAEQVLWRDYASGEVGPG